MYNMCDRVLRTYPMMDPSSQPPLRHHDMRHESYNAKLFSCLCLPQNKIVELSSKVVSFRSVGTSHNCPTICIIDDSTPNEHLATPSRERCNKRCPPSPRQENGLRPLTSRRPYGDCGGWWACLMLTLPTTRNRLPPCLHHPTDNASAHGVGLQPRGGELNTLGSLKSGSSNLAPARK